MPDNHTFITRSMHIFTTSILLPCPFLIIHNSDAQRHVGLLYFTFLHPFPAPRGMDAPRRIRTTRPSQHATTAWQTRSSLLHHKLIPITLLTISISVQHCRIFLNFFLNTSNLYIQIITVHSEMNISNFPTRMRMSTTSNKQFCHKVFLILFN